MPAHYHSRADPGRIDEEASSALAVETDRGTRRCPDALR